MAQKPSIPKGTRDFSPEEMAKRNYIFDTIKKSFRKYGYKQIETPAMENLSTLMGKYGEEGDKLLYKILNSGDFAKTLRDGSSESLSLNALAAQLCEKGLRYDLTVPFARFVVQHRNELQFPFKRYQIQPVWRADRPQKGRYREFYQCDADVVGSDSLNNEIELLSLIDDVYGSLGINVAVKINNRKILAGIAEAVGEADRLVDITVAIDKIDKIGIENVEAELLEKGISPEAVKALRPVLEATGSNESKMAVISEMLRDSEIGKKGIEEMRIVLEGMECLGHKCDIDVDLSLARGLNYYTGTIIEVKAKDVAIGSITGGGRYDNLTGVFGLPGVSGVGISFGADRIYDVLNQLQLYPEDIASSVKVIFLNLGEKESMQSLKYVRMLRNAGVSAQMYPDNVKMKKQMSAANADNISYVAIVGEEELAAGEITLKDMREGTQQKVTIERLIEIVKE